jgi:hypothetical protein
VVGLVSELSVLIAYAGYTLTFGLPDPAILTRSLIGVIALLLLMLAQLPAFLGAGRAG